MGETIHQIVRQAQTNYTSGTVKIGKYVDISIYEIIETITAYLNSKHITGDKDSLGRDKPFFNIVTAVVNIWYRATDIDRKDVRVNPDKAGNTIPALFANALLQDWMKRERFGVFLNNWGRTLAKFGSAVVKFVEKEGKLIPSVVPWSRIICDKIDFDSLPRIEKLYKTPAQLRQESLYDQDAVENLIETTNQVRRNLDGTSKDNKSEFIELYEVHAELSLATYKEAKGMKVRDGDDKQYRQQIHVLSYQKGADGKYNDYTLYCGYEKQDPYMLTHLIEEDDRTLSIGAVEYLFDAQWMENHTMKNMKDTLDLASKLIFQTADQNFIGRNILTQVETGHILNHADNKPLAQVNNTKADIASLQNFSNQWRILAQELTATPDAARGITPPSGTPLGTTQALLAQSNSLFTTMTQNKGFAIEDMLRLWIIPYLKTKMNTDKEIRVILDDHNLQKIDKMYIPAEAVRRFNARTTEAVLSGELVEPFNAELEEQGVKEGLASQGNERFLSPGEVNWKEALKDLEWELEVAVTNEPVDKQATLQTLSSLIQGVNPEMINNPFVKLLFTKIINLTGVVSPAELSAAASEIQSQPVAEVAGGAPAPGNGRPAPVL